MGSFWVSENVLMFWEWGQAGLLAPKSCFNIFNEQTNKPVFCLKPDINILAFADPTVSVEITQLGI